MPQSAHIRERKISPKFACIEFFQIRDVPTHISGHPGHCLSKTTEKGHLHKVFLRDIPTSGSLMSQEYPAQKLYVWAAFPFLTHACYDERIWWSPKASHIKANHPHFRRFRVCTFRIFRVFRVFALRNLLRPLFFWCDFPQSPSFYMGSALKLFREVFLFWPLITCKITKITFSQQSREKFELKCWPSRAPQNLH